MSTVPAVEIDGNDVTDEMQDRSLSIKFNAVDVTLIDPAVLPVIGDTLTVDTPAWSGTVNAIETVAYEGDVPFVKVRAVNTDPLPDNGAGAFNLSDAGTPQGNPAAYKDLSVNTQLQGTTTEVRAKLSIFKEGLAAGDEVDLTSAAHGYTAETFTIMELTTEYPIDNAARYTLDLGLGEYADATTGRDDGGPLSPIKLGNRTPGPGGPGGPGQGGEIANQGGGGEASSVTLSTSGSGNFEAAMGSHDLEWLGLEDTNSGYDFSLTMPASMGLTLDTATYIECTSAGMFTFDYYFLSNSAATGRGIVLVPAQVSNPTHYLLGGLSNTFGHHWWGSITFPMAVGDQVYLQYFNDGASSCLAGAELIVTRLGGWDGGTV